MPVDLKNSSTASGEASVCSTIINPLPPPAPAAKKKSSLPGMPDPEAEVIALSPKTLLAQHRFVCEICNKGFQRDQNLQLHRRGHNLPWKLKQKSGKEVRKRGYVCPEPTCAHHEPSRALGDLIGIKKHFLRKHGEKKWKCDKCSKRYAVQSDWKAHSKTCGTREYKCDCGTLFSRRDSFITHRAFCDALAEESAWPNSRTAAAASVTNAGAGSSAGGGPSGDPVVKDPSPDTGAESDAEHHGESSSASGGGGSGSGALAVAVLPPAVLSQSTGTSSVLLMGSPELLDNPTPIIEEAPAMVSVAGGLTGSCNSSSSSAEGLSGLCISRGAGRRCQFRGCTRDARQGSTMYCKAHGGGTHCTFPGCSKGAIGNSPFCKVHGGKCCAFQGGGVCTRSVYGVPNFCAAHGGGKRCALPACTKSARGRKDFCVSHGGGKRCKFEGYGESAQGSTEFCKAPGGGKRCSWDHPGSVYFGPSESFVRDKTVLGVLHISLVQDERVHGSSPKLPVQHLPKLLEHPHDVCPLRSLGVNLRAECIKELFLCCNITAQLQDLVNLKHIDLSSSNFTKIPDLSGVCKLQSLDLHGCKNLVDVSCIKYLTKLEYLNLNGCTSLMSLPSLMALKFLSSIDISDCKHLRRLPPSLGCLSCLLTLDLRNCKRIQSLPRSILRLKSLKVLSISGCSMLMECMSRVALSSSVDTGLVYPSCSQPGSSHMVFGHRENRGLHNSMHTLVEGRYFSKMSLQQFEEGRPHPKCDSEGKPSLERRTSYEMEELTGTEDAFNQSPMAEDLQWTPVDVPVTFVTSSSSNNYRVSSSSDVLTHHRKELKRYLNMPVEAIHQANAFDEVGRTTTTLIRRSSNLHESANLQSLLYCLEELQESVPETIACMDDAYQTRTFLHVKLADLCSTLAQAGEQYSLLAAEFARMSEEEAEVDAEIQRLLAKRDELIDEKNMVEVMH